MNLLNVVDNETFDNLDWEDIDRDQIPGLMQGYTVVDMEPMGIPELKSMGLPESIEGIIIYLEGKDQQLAALKIIADPEREKWDDAVWVSLANIPEKTK